MDGSFMVSRGIHPEVRRLCRDAARAISRYPVKDPLAFASVGEDDDDDDDEEEDFDDDLEEVEENFVDSAPVDEE